MVTIGPKNPGTMADDPAIGTLTWVNPDNAKVADTAYAIATGGNGAKSHYLKATNFGFSIPARATIDGIRVFLEGFGSDAVGGDIIDWEVKIVKSDGSIGSENKASAGAWNIINAKFWGSSTDLWSETWSAEDINDVDFGFVFSIDSQSTSGITTMNANHMAIYVSYTEAVDMNMQINISNSWKSVPTMKINIGNVWKNVVSVKQNVGNVWKNVS